MTLYQRYLWKLHVLTGVEAAVETGKAKPRAAALKALSVAQPGDDKFRAVVARTGASCEIVLVTRQFAPVVGSKPPKVKQRVTVLTAKFPVPAGFNVTECNDALKTHLAPLLFDNDAKRRWSVPVRGAFLLAVHAAQEAANGGPVAAAARPVFKTRTFIL